MEFLKIDRFYSQKQDEKAATYLLDLYSVLLQFDHVSNDARYFVLLHGLIRVMTSGLKKSDETTIDHYSEPTIQLLYIAQVTGTYNFYYETSTHLLNYNPRYSEDMVGIKFPSFMEDSMAHMIEHEFKQQVTKFYPAYPK